MQVAPLADDVHIKTICEGHSERQVSVHLLHPSGILIPSSVACRSVRSPTREEYKKGSILLHYCDRVFMLMLHYMLQCACCFALPFPPCSMLRRCHNLGASRWTILPWLTCGISALRQQVEIPVAQLCVALLSYAITVCKLEPCARKEAQWISCAPTWHSLPRNVAAAT